MGYAGVRRDKPYSAVGSRCMGRPIDRRTWWSTPRASPNWAFATREQLEIRRLELLARNLLRALKETPRQPAPPRRAWEFRFADPHVQCESQPSLADHGATCARRDPRARAIPDTGPDLRWVTPAHQPVSQCASIRRGPPGFLRTLSPSERG